MRYLALLGDDESTRPAPGTPERDADAGRLHALRRGRRPTPSWRARPCSRRRPPRPSATATAASRWSPSGPYAETTEALGGFYVLEADTLDDAIELARHIPSALARLGRACARWSTWQADRRPRRPADRYLALIYGKESPPTCPARPSGTRAPRRTAGSSRAAGDGVVAGGALHPIDTTTTVRVRDGELLVTDGPFSEAAEVVGGFYLLGAPTTDAAVELAAADPGRPRGRRRGAAVMADGGGRRAPAGPDPRRDRATPGSRSSARSAPSPGVRSPRSPACSATSRRRGRGAGGVRRGDAHLARAGRARPARGLDHHHGPQPGPRPCCAGSRARRPASRRRPGRRTRPPARAPSDGRPWTGRRGGAGGRRPAAADVHLLPPGPRAGGPGGTDAAPRVRAPDRRDRPGVPPARGHGRPAPEPGQGQDPHRQHPVPGAARPPARRAAARRCWPASTWCSPRGTRPAAATS